MKNNVQYLEELMQLLSTKVERMQEERRAGQYVGDSTPLCTWLRDATERTISQISQPYYGEPGDVTYAEAELWKKGEKIRAIKSYRGRNNATLKEGKEALEQAMSESVKPFNCCPEPREPLRPAADHPSRVYPTYESKVFKGLDNLDEIDPGEGSDGGMS